jgi:hypothetical protein
VAHEQMSNMSATGNTSRASRGMGPGGRG